MDTDENYFIKKAKFYESSDPFTAKSWILAAKSLSPNNFAVQFEVYKQEKAAKNYIEAAKCLSYIILTFQSQPPELWREISALTAALRAPDGNVSSEEAFYIELFQHISYDVQNRILTLLNTDNSLDYCQFVLLLMKKFPQTTHVHLPRLLEALVQNTSVSNQKSCIKMLLFEVVPMIIQKPPNDLPTNLVHRILTLGLEFYTSQIFLFNNGSVIPPVEFSDANLTTPVCWSRIFEIVEICGRILKWEPFLTYNSSWSKDVYWQKLLHIVSLSSTRPSESKQILFYGTILFVLSLQEYINSLQHKIDDTEIRMILIESLSDDSDPGKKSHHSFREPPNITVNPPCDAEVAILFRTAVQCWQLLQSNEILQMDFKQLLLSLPCSPYVNQFLVDLAFYLGQPDEAQTLLNDSTLGTSSLEKSLRHLSLTLHQPTFQIQAFDLIMKILGDLPAVTGNWMKNSGSNGRNMVFLPMTKRAILQYCAKILINGLKGKIGADIQNCRDSTLGCILVLIQLNYPFEYKTAEFVFDCIRMKQHFVYYDFSSYIICPDFLEEFMHIYTHESKVRLELSLPSNTAMTRRIGTRGSDRGIKDDFKQLIRKQMARSNDDIEALTVQFITKERLSLIQNLES